MSFASLSVFSLRIYFSVNFISYFLHPYISFYLPTYLPTYLPIYLSIYLSVCLSVCLSVYPSVRPPSVFLSVFPCTSNFSFLFISFPLVLPSPTHFIPVYCDVASQLIGAVSRGHSCSESRMPLLTRCALSISATCVQDGDV
jgi:hypothetical protein